MSFAVSILEQGLIYGILALGIYITYKILDFPDLTVDGSFPLGAAVTALMITKGANPYLTLPAAFAAGVAAGICTGLIHVKCKVRDLLSGIIMMTALWTINLRVAGTVTKYLELWKKRGRESNENSTYNCRKRFKRRSRYPGRYQNNDQ